MKKIFNLEFFAVIFLLFTILLFFLPIISKDNILFSADFTGSDYTELNIPYRPLAAQSFQQGDIPLWTDLLSTGFPLLAEGQTGVFYPFNWIFILFSFPVALNIIIISNFFLAGLFTYLYCRKIKLSILASLFSAIIFTLSGFFIFRIKHLNLINAAIWLPLLLYLFECYLIKHKRKSILVVFISIIFSLQFFAGHTQIFYISVIGCFAYSIIRPLFDKDINLFRNYLKIIFTWLVITIVIFGLTAIQFIPSFELSQISNRSSWISYASATAFKYHPANLITFLFPYFFGDPSNATYLQDIAQFGVFWESNIYYGILSILLALFAIMQLRKKRFVFIWLIILLFSLIFVFGNQTTIFKMFWSVIPGMKLFRFPQRFLLLTLFSLVVLSGLGFQIITDRIKTILEQKKLKGRVNIYHGGISFFILLLVVCDLYIFGLSYNNIISYKEYFSPTQSSQYLLKDEDQFRIYSIDWMSSWQRIYNISRGWQDDMSLFYSYRELLPPNLNVFYNIATIDDRGLLEGGLGGVDNFNQIHQRVRNNIRSSVEDNSYKISEIETKILGMQNVKYLLSFDILENKDLELVKEIPAIGLPDVRIYKNNRNLPRAFALFKYKKMFESEMLPYMFSDDFQPDNEILIGEDFDLNNTKDSEGDETVIDITDYSANKIVLNANYSKPGFLFLSQVFYPGWRAQVDDKEVEILRSNYAFSSVLLEEGSHEVIFYYQPLSYSVGKYITIVTIIIIIIYLPIILFIKKYNDKIQNKL